MGEDRRMRIVATLLDAGANPNIQNERGRTILTWTAREGTEEAVEILLDAGADPDLRGDYPSGEEVTALMLAARHENKEVVEALLSAGADPSLKNKDGEKAFQMAQSKDVKNMLSTTTSE
jgi:ankyrin repeat protein